MSEEHEDTVITANHLIYGRDIDRNESVQHKFSKLSGDDVRKRQAYCQVIFKHFTTSCSLKATCTTCSLKVSDLVIIKEDIIPRLSWKKGVVDQIITGHDIA